MKLAIITVSDSASTAAREDLSGPTLLSLVKQSTEIIVESVENFVVPDDREHISTKFIELCDRVDVILSTGGTGFSPRDVTPEATLSVIERRCGGLETALHLRSLQATPLAALSRLCAGIRGSTLIINMPGNPQAVKECFEIIEKVLQHAVQLLHCDSEKITKVHREVQYPKHDTSEI